MSDGKGPVQLRFLGKRPSTRKAKLYMDSLNMVGYANKTEFAEDAIVFYFDALTSRTENERLFLRKGLAHEEELKQKEKNDYEDALKYIDEERRRIQ